MNDEWTTCARCGEPKRNHMFSLCEGGETAFVSYQQLEDRIKELTNATLKGVSTEDLKMELHRRARTEVCPVCKCPEPGKHKLGCQTGDAS